MSLYKRGDTYWTDFSVNGQRFRVSLDTSDWREAQRLQKERITEASQGKLAPASQQFARLAFGEAADRFLADRIPHLAARSIQTEKERSKPLKEYFGATALSRISADHILRYVVTRKDAGLSNKTINLELGVLRGVLKRAKRWHLLADEIKPLPIQSDVGQALSYEEKLRLIRTAAKRPEWLNARLAMVLALNTTMRGCEIKGLRWRSVDFMDRNVTVRRASTKTDKGQRLIPLNVHAWNAILELWDRAKLVGEAEPNHFVFPACENGNVDPNRPMKSWRSAWRKLTRVIECPGCRRLQNPGQTCVNPKCQCDIRDLKSTLASLRFHDMRHQAITELAESEASDQTILSIAGHVSREMLEHYSHIRIETKRHAVEALARSTAQEKRYVTSNVTIDVLGDQSNRQVPEKNGRGERI
jgi:integrase